jgi:hypothetical protein
MQSWCNSQKVTLVRVGSVARVVLMGRTTAPPPQQQLAPVALLRVGPLVWSEWWLECVALASAPPAGRLSMAVVPSAPKHRADAGLAGAIAFQSEDLPDARPLDSRPYGPLGGFSSRTAAAVTTWNWAGMPAMVWEGRRSNLPALVLNHDLARVVEQYGPGGFARGSTETLGEFARRAWHDRANRETRSERSRGYIQTYNAPALGATRWLRISAAPPLSEVETSPAGAETICAA